MKTQSGRIAISIASSLILVAALAADAADARRGEGRRLPWWWSAARPM